MVKTSLPQSLYEQDLVAWCDDTVAKLKAGDFEAIDIESLIEEVEGLAKRDRRELKSRLRVLLIHLLKRRYVNSPNDYRGWEITIREQRQQLVDLLEQSPSLRQEIVARFPQCWGEALAIVREDYPQTPLPDEWDASADVDDLLNQRFW